MKKLTERLKEKKLFIIAAAVLMITAAVFIALSRRYDRAEEEEGLGNPLAAAEIYYSLGFFRDSRERAEALWAKETRKASAEDAVDYEALYSIIESRSRAGRYSAEETRRLNTDLLNRQAALLMQYGKYKDAVGILSRRLYLDPGFRELIREAHYQTGLSYLSAGYYPGAISAFNDAGDYKDAQLYLNALDGRRIYWDPVYYHKTYGDPDPDGNEYCLWNYRSGLNEDGSLRDSCALITLKHRENKTLQVIDLRFYDYSHTEGEYMIYKTPGTDRCLSIYGTNKDSFIIAYIDDRSFTGPGTVFTFDLVGSYKPEVDTDRLMELARPYLFRELALAGDPFFSAYTDGSRTTDGKHIDHVCGASGCTNPTDRCYEYLPNYYFCPLHDSVQRTALRRRIAADDADVKQEALEIRNAEEAEARRKAGGSSYSSSSGSRKDPYDVHSYSDPDDFADEWAEEFADSWDADWEDGYDDAYDYWMENH